MTSFYIVVVIDQGALQLHFGVVATAPTLTAMITCHA